MQTLTVPKTMLICPKCQKVYEDDSQRFCLNDGSRLVPKNASQQQKPSQTQGVFSGVLSKKGFFEDTKTEFKNLPPKVFREPLKPSPKVEENLLEISEFDEPKTFSKPVKPNEVSNNQTPLANRVVKPAGRAALTSDNPNILLGQTVKGRYFINSRISQTAHGIKYLAADKLNADKKAIIRIFTGRLDGSDFSAKIFKSEIVSLSGINHPNIAKVFDSGALPEGNPFIVSDYVKGISLREKFSRVKSFDLLQTAHLISQSSDAIGEAHRNGVLHRNLNPDNLILSIDESGAEQINITDFNIFSDISRGDFSFLAPEQLCGKPAEISSDIFSLAVIAYKMLTGKMPFSALTSKELFKLQQGSLQIPATELNGKVPEQTFEILQKALAFRPENRFQNIREFGDAFYASLISEKANLSENQVPSAKNEVEDDDFSISLDSVLEEPEIIIAEPKASEIIEQPELLTKDFEEVELELDKPTQTPETQTSKPARKIALQLDDDIPWERRSIEPPPQGGRSLTLFAILGISCLFVLSALIFYYFINRPAEQKYVNIPTENQTVENQTRQNTTNQTPGENKTDVNEIPPPPRTVEQPEGTLYFANTKENLSKELLKNFRGFYLYYPSDWKINKFDKNRNKVDNKFIDISKSNADGLPLEQFMVSYYDSNGTFEADKDDFPAIVERAGEEIKKSPLPNFRLVGSGLVNLNKTESYDGWKAYEMKFQGEGTAMNGDKIKLFGRRFYIPAARKGVKKGLVVTLLATSLSSENASADDLGTKGDLKTILSTFEPDQNF